MARWRPKAPGRGSPRQGVFRSLPTESSRRAGNRTYSRPVASCLADDHSDCRPELRRRLPRPDRGRVALVGLLRESHDGQRLRWTGDAARAALLEETDRHRNQGAVLRVAGEFVKGHWPISSTSAAIRPLATSPRGGVGALIQRGGRAVAGMLTIATAGGS